MELRSDIVLKGEEWAMLNNRLVGTFFDTQWGLFKTCLSIGILYDSHSEDVKIEGTDGGVNIPRGMFNREASVMEFYFQSAVLTTRTISLNEKDRVYLAFASDISSDDMEGEDYNLLTKGVTDEAINFNKIAFLKKFANYGAIKLAKCVSSNDNETMEQIMEFLLDSYRGETEELLNMKEVPEDYRLIEFD